MDHGIGAQVAYEPEVIAQQHAALSLALGAAQIDELHPWRRHARQLRRRRRGEHDDIVAAALLHQFGPQLLEINPVAGEIGPEAGEEVKDAERLGFQWLDPNSTAAKYA